MSGFGNDTSLMGDVQKEWLFDMHCKIILSLNGLVAILTVFVGHVQYGLHPHGLFGPFDVLNGPNENEYDKCKTDH